MSYEQFYIGGWKNNSLSEETPISAESLDHIEQGIIAIETNLKSSRKVLFDGIINIPSRLSGNQVSATLTDKMTDFDEVHIRRRNLFVIIKPTDNIEIIHTLGSSFGIEALNSFGCSIINTDSINPIFKNNFYYGVYTNGTSLFENDYTGQPITEIIGIKYL